MALPLIAIVGRPNVGKSTLYNRLARKKLALVDDRPGATRDWRTAEASIADLHFTIADTAGLEDAEEDSIASRMLKGTEALLQRADALIFVVDGVSGLTPMDNFFADRLRKVGKPIILIVNKCENARSSAAGLAEAYRLGFGEPIIFSAEHAVGFDELYSAIDKTIGNKRGSMNEAIDDEEEDDEAEDVKSIKLAIVGRPNAGKSTLLNSFLKQERALTGPEAGLTRDSIAAEWMYKDRQFRLVDTAGLRRKAKIEDQLEKRATAETFRAVRLAHIVVLVIDGTRGFDKQDIAIARHVADEGRVLILAVNKWDVVNNKDDVRQQIDDKLQTSFSQIKDIPVVYISALQGQNLTKLMAVALEHFNRWNKRLSTGPLNRWLAVQTQHHPPPMVDGRNNNIKYMTQIKSRPPTFALWAGHSDKLADSYKRYLMNGLQTDFDLGGIPLRLLVKTGKNPYV